MLWCDGSSQQCRGDVFVRAEIMNSLLHKSHGNVWWWWWWCPTLPHQSCGERMWVGGRLWASLLSCDRFPSPCCGCVFACMLVVCCGMCALGVLVYVHVCVCAVRERSATHNLIYNKFPSYFIPMDAFGDRIIVVVSLVPRRRHYLHGFAHSTYECECVRDKLAHVMPPLRLAAVSRDRFWSGSLKERKRVRRALVLC